MSSWGAVIGVAASACIVVAGLLGILRWVIAHEIRVVRDELKPNSGTSFRDHVDRRLDGQDGKLADHGERLAAIEGALGVRR